MKPEDNIGTIELARLVQRNTDALQNLSKTLASRNPASEFGYGYGFAGATKLAAPLPRLEVGSLNFYNLSSTIAVAFGTRVFSSSLSVAKCRVLWGGNLSGTDTIINRLLKVSLAGDDKFISPVVTYIQAKVDYNAASTLGAGTLVQDPATGVFTGSMPLTNFNANIRYEREFDLRYPFVKIEYVDRAWATVTANLSAVWSTVNPLIVEFFGE